MDTRILKTKSFRTLIISMVVCALILAAVVFLHQKNRNDGNQLVESYKLVKQQQELRVEYNRIEDVLQKTQEQRDALALYVLANGETEVVDFLSYLESVASQVGVDFNTKTLEIITPKKETPYLNLQIMVEGSEQQVFDMIRLMEVVPYHLTMSNLSVQRDEEADVTTATIGFALTVSDT